MAQTPNPYIAGSPVTGPEMFFGREDVFNFVKQALTGQHRDHVLVLYGQRRTGKTSVLYQMNRQLGDRYVCIFIDLHGLALNGLSGFLWELANHIHRALRREHEVNLPPLERDAFQDEPRSAFENAFLDSIWERIGDRRLLLMFDEAVRLEEQVQAGKLEIQVFDYLRHLMQHHPRLSFLFSLGSGLEEMQKEYAFLFNVALYKKISFLDRASAEALITKPVADRCPFQSQAVQRILEVTSGHPYFTQLICHSLFNRCLDASSVTVSDVEQVLDEAVERGLAVLKHIWEESAPGEKAVLAAIAATQVDEAHAIQDQEAEQPQPGRFFEILVKWLDDLGLTSLVKLFKELWGRYLALGKPGRPSDRDQVIPAPVPKRGISSEEIVQTWAGRGITLTESEAARSIRRLVARDVIGGAGEYTFTVDLMRLWVQKFRRLEWVKEEIEEAAQSWGQKERERQDRLEQSRALPAGPQPAMEAEDEGQALPETTRLDPQLQTGTLERAARQAVDRPETDTRTAEVDKHRTVPRRRFNLPILNIILAMAGLLAIAYFASELLFPREGPAAPAVLPEPQGGENPVILGGDALRVTSLALLGDFVWASTEAGLVRWSADGSSQLYSSSDLGMDCINILAARHSDNTLWMGCGGVAVARLERGEPAYYGFYDRDSGLGMGAVRALTIDPDGDVWAGGAPTQDRPPPLTVLLGSAADGIWVAVGEINERLSALFEGSPQSININSITFDSQGRLWLGLREGGIVQVNDQDAIHYPPGTGGLLDSLADLRIRRILEDQGGMLWAAASERGLLRLQPGGSDWEPVEVMPGGTPIYSVAEFSDGSLWAAGDRMVMRSTDGGQTWSTVGSPDDLGDEILALVEDDSGLIWAGDYGGGVSVWNGETWTALQR